MNPTDWPWQGAVPMRFDRFMELALHDPERGYYARRIRGVGKGGDFTTTPTGLQYLTITPGTGDVTAKVGDEVTVNYTGWLKDTGALFDSSLKPGRTPFTRVLSEGNLIKGWVEGVAGMKVGETRRLIVPPDLGYGAAGSPPIIPANATLIFDITLLNTGPAPAATAAP